MNIPGGQVLAVSGDICNVAGSYSTTAGGAIAWQATGVNALITGPSEGTVTFSTAGASANGLQADGGGAISLTPTLAAPATVTTTGVGSIGLVATGSGEGRRGPCRLANHDTKCQCQHFGRGGAEWADGERD